LFIAEGYTEKNEKTNETAIIARGRLSRRGAQPGALVFHLAPTAAVAFRAHFVCAFAPLWFSPF
jgi:hypothetical protein